MPERRAHCYPEPDVADPGQPEPARPRPTWHMVAVIVVIGLVLAIIVIAHLGGAIGPGVHQPSGS